MRTLAEIEAYIKSEFNDTSTGTQTQIRRLINAGIRAIKAYTAWPFDEKRGTDTTVASTSSYNLPKDFHQLRTLKITSGGIDYYPDFIPSRDHWDRITGGMNSTSESDIPEYFTIYQGKFYIWPVPSSAGNTITYDYYQLDKDYEDAEYTDQSTGTISIANGSNEVTGIGTTFLATDVGRYIRLNGYWYKISTFTSTTRIDLERNYEGTSISGGTYLLGTVTNFSAQYPEVNMVLVDYVLQYLWRRREDVSATGGKASHFKNTYKEGLKELRKRLKNLNDKPQVHYPRERTVFNPNLDPTNLTT